MAVNVTAVPVVEQIDVDVEVIDTDGVTNAFTTMVTVLLVAGLPVAQGVAFEVRITFTISLFAKVVVVNVLLLLPAFELFTCH